MCNNSYAKMSLKQELLKVEMKDSGKAVDASEA